jgi:hypothetical protein
MEVDGGLLEGTLHFLMQAEGCLDHEWYQLLHIALITREVLAEEGTEDSEERLLFRELDGTEEEVTLETWVDHERTGSGVHGSHVHGALDLLDGELCPVVPMLVIFMLTHKSDGTLSIVLVEGRHVEVINEVKELELADGSVDLTSSAFELLL